MNKSVEVILSAVKSAGEAALRLHDENEGLRSERDALQIERVNLRGEWAKSLRLLWQLRDDIQSGSQLAEFDAYMAGLDQPPEVSTEARALVQRALEVAGELDDHDEHGPSAEDVAQLLRQLAEALEEEL